MPTPNVHRLWAALQRDGEPIRDRDAIVAVLLSKGLNLHAAEVTAGLPEEIAGVDELEELSRRVAHYAGVPPEVQLQSAERQVLDDALHDILPPGATMPYGIAVDLLRDTAAVMPGEFDDAVAGAPRSTSVNEDIHTRLSSNSDPVDFHAAFAAMDTELRGAHGGTRVAAPALRTGVLAWVGDAGGDPDANAVSVQQVARALRVAHARAALPGRHPLERIVDENRGRLRDGRRGLASAVAARRAMDPAEYDGTLAVDVSVDARADTAGAVQRHPLHNVFTAARKPYHIEGSDVGEGGAVAAAPNPLLPLRVLPYGDIAGLEAPPEAGRGVPVRAASLPFAADIRLKETLLREVVGCWFAKILPQAKQGMLAAAPHASGLWTMRHAPAGDDPPTVLDEILANLTTPAATETASQHAVGDPIAVVAELAFALHARLGPDHPRLSPAGLMLLHMLTLEAPDVDRYMQFADVPSAVPRNTEPRGVGDGDDAAARDDGDDSMTGLMITEAIRRGHTTVYEAYGKKHAGHRNPAMAAEVARVMKQLHEAFEPPRSVLKVTVSRLLGLHSGYEGQALRVEAQVTSRDIAALQTEPRVYTTPGEPIAYGEVFFVPLLTPNGADGLETVVELYLSTDAGERVAKATFLYPADCDNAAKPDDDEDVPESATAVRVYLTPVETALQLPQAGADASAVRAAKNRPPPAVADLRLFVERVRDLDPAATRAVVELTGGDEARKEARLRLFKWVKVLCAVPAIQEDLHDAVTSHARGTGAGDADVDDLTAVVPSAALPTFYEHKLAGEGKGDPKDGTGLYHPLAPVLMTRDKAVADKQRERLEAHPRTAVILEAATERKLDKDEKKEDDDAGKPRPPTLKGVDVTRISYFPDEATVVVSPFAALAVEEAKGGGDLRAAVGLQPSTAHPCRVKLREGEPDPFGEGGRTRREVQAEVDAVEQELSEIEKAVDAAKKAVETLRAALPDDVEPTDALLTLEAELDALLAERERRARQAAALRAELEQLPNLSDEELAERKVVAYNAALRRFYAACREDIRRADQQLKWARDRLYAARHPALMYAATDAWLHAQLQEGAYRVDDHTPRALPRWLEDRLADRMAPMPHASLIGVAYYAPRAPAPAQWLTGRESVEPLLVELMRMWKEKPGDVLDELLDNLVLPVHRGDATAGGGGDRSASPHPFERRDAVAGNDDAVAGIDVLAALCSTLRNVHGDERRMVEHLACVLMAADALDVDRIALLHDAPPAVASAEEKHRYAAFVGDERNPSLFALLGTSVAAMADLQHLQRPGSHTPLYRHHRAIVQRWIKLFGLFTALGTDLPETPDVQCARYYRTASPPASELARVSAAARAGGWVMWPSAVRCAATREAAVAPTATSPPDITFVLRGVRRTLDLAPYQQRYRPGDACEDVVLPPFTSFLVGEVTTKAERRAAARGGDDGDDAVDDDDDDDDDDNLVIELLCRESLPTDHPGVRRWGAACAADARAADARLTRAFASLRDATARRDTARADVAIGRKVTITTPPSALFAALHEATEFRYLLTQPHKHTLRALSERGEIGTVGNVTFPEATDVQTLQHSLLAVAHELRGEPAPVMPDHRPDPVASVAFPDGSLFLLPFHVLDVHPISYFPELPSTVRVHIRWADLPRDVVRAHVRVETPDDIRQQPSAATATLRDGCAFVTNTERDVSDYDDVAGVAAAHPLLVRLPVYPGEDGARPLWEEAVEFKLNREQMSARPCVMTFTVFEEPNLLGTEEADADAGDPDARRRKAGATDDEKIVGAVTIHISPYVLVETLRRPKHMSMFIAPPEDAHVEDPQAMAVAAERVQPERPRGVLHIAVELVDDAEDAAVLVDDHAFTTTAEPLSWRAGAIAMNRTCTACDAGGTESVDAVYVCVECQMKLCEDCWVFEHRRVNPHASLTEPLPPDAGAVLPKAELEPKVHAPLLLYHHCDFCYVDCEALGYDGDDAGQPALYHCADCKLNLCKQCYYDEHRHPQRRPHFDRRIFLYPGGRFGRFSDATYAAQRVAYGAAPFTSQNFRFKQHRVVVCGECKTADAVLHWDRPVVSPLDGFAGGGAAAPRTMTMRLCEACYTTAASKVQDATPTAQGAAPPAVPPPALLLQPCALCDGLERRPALWTCAACDDLPLCTVCWRAQHRHPHRRDHARTSLLPPDVEFEGTRAHKLHEALLSDLRDYALIDAVEEPVIHVPGQLDEAIPAAAAPPRASEFPSITGDLGDAGDAPDGYTIHDGYLAGGDDIVAPRRMTVKAAKEMASRMPHCAGFTFKEENGVVPGGKEDGGEVLVFFKDRFKLHGQGKGKGWCAYKKTEAQKKRPPPPIKKLCRHGALAVHCGPCGDDRDRERAEFERELEAGRQQRLQRQLREFEDARQRKAAAAATPFHAGLPLPQPPAPSPATLMATPHPMYAAAPSPTYTPNNTDPDPPRAVPQYPHAVPAVPVKFPSPWDSRVQDDLARPPSEYIQLPDPPLSLARSKRVSPTRSAAAAVAPASAPPAPHARRPGVQARDISPTRIPLP